MNRLGRLAAMTTLSAFLMTGMAWAQDDHHDDNHGDAQHQSDAQHQNYVKHKEWHKGAKINHDDWAGASRWTGRHTTCGSRRGDMSGARWMGIMCWRR